MRTRLLFAVSAFALLASPAFSAETAIGSFTGNLALKSDYAFRGITQTDENPALQGGFDYSHSSGIYAGMWGSNVDFGDDDEASLELDLYAGYAGEIKGITYSVGGIFYNYPGTEDDLDYDFWEAAGTLGYDFGVASVKGSLNYSPNYFADSGDAIYTNAAVSVPLPYNFSANAAAGYQWIDKEDSFGVSDYADWTLGIGYAWEGFDFSASYVDTDVDKNECDDNCDARFILGVSRKF